MDAGAGGGMRIEEKGGGGRNGAGRDAMKERNDKKRKTHPSIPPYGTERIDRPIVDYRRHDVVMRI